LGMRSLAHRSTGSLDLDQARSARAIFVTRN
jgi:hypothetical protein